MASKKESSVESYFVRRCQANGWECIKFVSPGHRGVPDRIVMLGGGRAAFVELKRPSGGKASPLQLYWNRHLEELGFIAGFAKSREEADKLIERIKSEYGIHSS